MAFKDAINKMVSYFDTDEVSEVEEESMVAKREEAQAQEPRTRPVSSPQQASRPNPNQAVSRPLTSRSQHSEQEPLPTYPRQNRQETMENIERRSNSREARFPSSHQEQYSPQGQAEKTRIALKYPKKYEDAQEIVDLFIENECVLIDFQYMLDAQARRCLDFIDGASKVLYGTLQKVGSSMYLLTPSNVSVNIEDMNIPNHNNHNQDFGYDFDMKRR